MSETSPLPERETLKHLARRLRRALENEGNFISHSEALELVAHQHGYRDWNTLHAACGNKPPQPFRVGSKIRGDYLGQSFSAEIVSVTALAGGDRYTLTLDLDEAVDVVTFDRFSAFRKRVRASVRRDGRSDARTSNGEPHLRLAL